MTPVERAAEAFYEDPNGITNWSRMAEVEHDLADRYREAMTRALTAALDVDELAAVLHDAACVCDRTTHPAESWVNWTNYARAVVAHLTKGNENDE